jgi:hypothetical protein
MTNLPVILNYKEFFDTLVDGMSINSSYITYNNASKRALHYDYYTIIYNDEAFDLKTRVEWELYVKKYFKNKSLFNKWCKTKRNQPKKCYDHIQFITSGFNIYFLPVDNYLEAYTRTEKKGFQLHFLTCSTKLEKFWKECITYLQISGNTMASYSVPDYILINALKKAVANKVNFISDIRKISNIVSVPTHLYIDLNLPKACEKHIEAWIIFMSQFSTEKMRIQFMSWIYGLFYDKDNDRRILWIQGDNDTGKSSVSNALTKFIMNINKHSVKDLADNKDLFKLDNFDKCRLLIIADLKNPNIFENQLIYNITGGDYQGIREPREAPRLVQIMSKILVTSNIAPNVNKHKGDQVSRMLYINMNQTNILAVKDKINDTYRQRLENQLPMFISYCKEFYTKPKRYRKKEYAVKHY